MDEAAVCVVRHAVVPASGMDAATVLEGRPCDAADCAIAARVRTSASRQARFLFINSPRIPPTNEFRGILRGELMKRNLACLLALVLTLAAMAQSAASQGLPSNTVAASNSLAGTTACLTTQTAASSIPAGDIALALVALTLSFDVVAVGYILSRIFPSTGIKEWLNTEYWEIAKTAMLIVGIYAVLSLLGNAASLVAPSSGASSPSGLSGMYGLVNSGCAYLSAENAFAGTTLNYLFGLSIDIGILKNTVVGMEIPIPIPPYAQFQSGFEMSIYWNSMLEGSTPSMTYQSMLEDLLKIIVVPVTYAIEAQLTLLPIIFALGLGALIPLGLLLRAMPFVRGIGGTLIAIGIGLSLIYPATLALMNYPITVALQGSAITPPQAQCQGQWVVCGLAGIVFSTFSQGATGASWGDAVMALTTIYPALNDILYYTEFMMLQFFLFILDLAIIFPLVDGIAKMLGGTIRLSIGGKLKLV